MIKRFDHDLLSNKKGKIESLLKQRFNKNDFKIQHTLKVIFKANLDELPERDLEYPFTLYRLQTKMDKYYPFSY